MHAFTQSLAHHASSTMHVALALDLGGFEIGSEGTAPHLLLARCCCLWLSIVTPLGLLFFFFFLLLLVVSAMVASQTCNQAVVRLRSCCNRLL